MSDPAVEANLSKILISSLAFVINIRYHDQILPEVFKIDTTYLLERFICLVLPIENTDISSQLKSKLWDSLVVPGIEQLKIQMAGTCYNCQTNAAVVALKS